MATTRARHKNRRTNSGGTINASSPLPTPSTKGTSARILSEDRTTRRRKYIIFWPGREDQGMYQEDNHPRHQTRPGREGSRKDEKP